MVENKGKRDERLNNEAFEEATAKENAEREVQANAEAYERVESNVGQEVAEAQTTTYDPATAETEIEANTKVPVIDNDADQGGQAKTDDTQE